MFQLDQHTSPSRRHNPTSSLKLAVKKVFPHPSPKKHPKQKLFTHEPNYITLNVISQY